MQFRRRKLPKKVPAHCTEDGVFMCDQTPTVTHFRVKGFKLVGHPTVFFVVDFRLSSRNIIAEAARKTQKHVCIFIPEHVLADLVELKAFVKLVAQARPSLKQVITELVNQFSSCLPLNAVFVSRLNRNLSIHSRQRYVRPLMPGQTVHRAAGEIARRNRMAFRLGV